MAPPFATRGRVPRRIDAVLLDLFGTLIPTGSQVARIHNLAAMARELGVDPESFAGRWLSTFDERARGVFGSLEETIERFARELGGTPNQGAVDRAAALRTGFARSLFDTGRSSLPALDALTSTGLRLAVVSDTSDDTVRVWPETAFAARFEAAVFSCVEGFRKPDPRMFRAALERLHVAPAACVFVGDGGSNELSGAEAVGVSAYQYCFPGEGDAAFRVDADPNWAGARLTDLGDLLRLVGTREGNPRST
jgi:putative hydrolase of the HAD superfamily